MSLYETLSHSKVFTGKILDVYHDEVVLENGKTALREVIEHVGASAILPVDREGNILFVRQYRHPARKTVLEIPAGTHEKNEDPKVCAIRELEEETGFRGNKFTFLTKFYSAIGYSDEVLYIYLAEDLEEGTQNFDEDEFVTIEKYSLDEAVKLIKNGEIVDSKTIAAVLLYKDLKSER